jgi:hypothetical protein
MDRSNLLLGAGVLVGLGAVAYWLLNRSGGSSASTRRPLTKQQWLDLISTTRGRIIKTTWDPSWRAAEKAAGGVAHSDILRDDTF